MKKLFTKGINCVDLLKSSVFLLALLCFGNQKSLAENRSVAEINSVLSKNMASYLNSKLVVAGDINLRFVAAAPQSYNHITGGGNYGSGVIGTDIVTSLQGGDFACGQVTTYFTRIAVASNATLNGLNSISIDYSYLAAATGQPGVALGEITKVQINTGDPAMIDNAPAASVTSNPASGSNPGDLPGTISGTKFVKPALLKNRVIVDGLTRGDVIILRVDVRIDCNGQSPTGNLQASLDACKVIGINGSAANVSTGNQTVPFKNVDAIQQGSCLLTNITNACVNEVKNFVVSGLPAGMTNPTYAWSFTSNTAGATFVQSNGNALPTPNTPGSVSSVYVKATNASGGSYTVSLTATQAGFNIPACTRTVTVNPIPAIASPLIGDVCLGATSASLTHSGVTNGDKYRIEWNTAAKTAGLQDVSSTDVPVGAISINIPAAVGDGTYSGTIFIDNSTTGCTGSAAISLKINPLPDISGLNVDAICQGSTSAAITYNSVSNGADQYRIDWQDHDQDANTPEIPDVAYTTLPSNPNTIVIPNTGSLVSGSYSGDLYVKNSTTGCESVKHIIMLVVSTNPSKPAVEYIPPTCTQTTFSLKITGVVQGSKYLVVDKNGADIANISPATSIATPYVAPNTNDITFSNIPVGSGYIVTRITAGGCVSAPESCGVPAPVRQAAPITQPTIGNAKDLIAYPVPFSENVTVEFKASKAENYVINLYDLQGHLVKELKAGNAKAGEVIKVQVSGHGMAESMYLVRKVSHSGISTVKLLKKE